MVQSRDSYNHSLFEKLDAAIEQLNSTSQELNAVEPDASIRKAQSIITQMTQDIESIRHEATTTLKRLSMFGATLETLARPEQGIDAVTADVFRWCLLLTEAERAFLSLYNAEEDALILKEEFAWMETELRPIEQIVSENTVAKVMETRDVITTGNIEMASDSYTKSGSWRIPLRTVIGIPFIFDGEIIGVFYGDKKIVSGMIQRDMLALFKLYAAQAAIAIRNARLFAELHKKPAGD